MYRITGKQRFGAVWHKGECLAVFKHGEAFVEDEAVAGLLSELGYTVEAVKRKSKGR